MKLTKQRLKEIIKGELGTLSEDTETDQRAIDSLKKIMEEIHSVYNNSGSSQELFAKYLEENINLVLQTWEEERQSVVARAPRGRSPYSGRKAYKALGPGGTGLGMASPAMRKKLKKWFNEALKEADDFQMEEIIEEVKDILGVNI